LIAKQHQFVKTLHLCNVSGLISIPEICKSGDGYVKKLPLREIAHSRSGEKGRDSNISVVAYDERDYELLRTEVTVDAVQRLFGPITKGRITRYEVPKLGALNFVVEDVLEGGRTRTLAFDESGKALSSLMLRLEVSVPDGYVGRSANRSREVSR
jgi:hypothetical protein